MAGVRTFRGASTQSVLTAPIFEGRAALATTATTGTLTVPQVQAGQLAVTPAQAITLTLPTAALLFAWLGATGAGELTIANIAGTGAITLAAGTGGTLFELNGIAASEVIASGAKSRLRFEMNGAAAYSVYLEKFVAV